MKWINQKIGRQLMFAFYMVFIALSLTSAIVYTYTERKIDQTNATFDDLRERRTNANTLANEWTLVQSNVKSYVLFGTPEILDTIKANQREINRLTTWFEKMPFTNKERNMRSPPGHFMMITSGPPFHC
ncbi:CHASE3 domain-containing protein [Exiguobacterium artemiae]